MKVIDLLNKIANGEEVPKMIRYSDTIFEYDEDYKNYESINMTGDIFSYIDGTNINDEIEIICENTEKDKINLKLSELQSQIDKLSKEVLIKQKEEIINAIENLPHIEIDNKRPISAYDSVDMKDIQYIIDNMNDNIKTYIELVQENRQLKDIINKAIELLNIRSHTNDIQLNMLNNLNIMDKTLEILKLIKH